MGRLGLEICCALTTSRFPARPLNWLGCWARAPNSGLRGRGRVAIPRVRKIGLNSCLCLLLSRFASFRFACFAGLTAWKRRLKRARDYTLLSSALPTELCVGVEKAQAFDLSTKRVHVNPLLEMFVIGAASTAAGAAALASAVKTHVGTQRVVVLRHHLLF